MLIYFDLETTGLSRVNDEIIEIFMIKEDENFKIVDTFHSYFYPGKRLPLRIIQVTNITDKMLWNQPLFKDVAEKIIQFIGDGILVGHNVDKFDLPFLNEQLNKSGLQPLDNETYDTMSIARKLDNVSSMQKGYKLIDLAYKYKLNFNSLKLHGAKYDTEITRKIFHLLINK